MKKYFFPFTSAALILFSVWLYLRNNIWSNSSLYPSELVIIYARDSSTFFITLRLVFIGLWSWGAYKLWASGKSVYMWTAALLYAAFMLADSAVLYRHYTQYVQQQAILGEEFPWLLFKAVPEAGFTLLFHLVALLFLQYSYRKKFDIEIA